ncbi:MAG: HD domain-containing protein, partial [Lachnospiraceae bacterium]|nr:HD domain-containing protein [Lachnospiraceae bacterium]
MMDFLQEHQLDFMLALSGICAFLAFLILIAGELSQIRKLVMILMEVGAVSLISFDRVAYVYSGDVSRSGYIMVRVSNFIVFFMTAGIVMAFNLYLIDLLKDEGHMPSAPRRLKLVGIMAAVEMLLVIVSQFTDMYYYFDEMNRYHRGPLFLLSYVIPVVGPLIQFTVIRQYRSLISRLIYISLLLFIFVPIVFAIIQIWAYGLSLVNIAMVFVAVGVYVFAYLDINQKVERANRLEIEYLKDNQGRTLKMFDQTARAIVDALDARNAFDRGHSERVARYSRRIAEICGKSREECDRVFYSALLHDIGKIGLQDNKDKKDYDRQAGDQDLSKQLPIIGNKILSKIEDFPYLSIGAHFHCERYDGRGYPEGLAGEQIPEIARIVSVADAYDRMTFGSDHSEPLSPYIVREEIMKGSGV